MRRLPHQVIALIHYVELSKAGWWDTTVDRCILAVLWMLQEPSPTSQLRTKTAKELDIDLKSNEVERSLKRLQDNNQVLKLDDGRWKLAVATEQQLRKQVEEARQLEECVKAKFVSLMKGSCPQMDYDRCWKVFNEKFFVPLITDVGARVYEFFFMRTGEEEWISYTDHFLEEIPEQYRDSVNKVVISFIDPSDPEIARYILTYLDAYFVITSSGLESKTARKLSELRTKPAQFVVFVDTNFVYSILGLHENPLNVTANDLMDLVRSVSDQVKVDFVISPVTLKEARQSIKYYKSQLGDMISYPANVAEAAGSSEIYGIYRTFFERVKQSGRQISPDEYFGPYESHLEQILAEKGVSVFTQGNIAKYEDYPDVLTDVERQVEYETAKYAEHAKSELRLKNDMMLWHFVRDLRDDRAQTPLEARYWIATVDFRLLRFDQYKAKKETATPICMLPAQFTQVLRFFVPRSEHLEKIVLDTLRFPLIIREFDPKAEKITLRIIRQLSRFEGITDLSVETIQRVLTDQTLRSRLEMTSGMSESEEASIVKTTLLQQVKDFEEAMRAREQKVEELKSLAESQNRESHEQRGMIRTLEEKLLNQLQEQRGLQDALTTVQEELAELKEADAAGKATRTFVAQSLLVVAPYPLLLALGFSAISGLLESWGTYLIAAVATLLIAVGVSKLLVSLGERDQYVSRATWFLKMKQRLAVVVVLPILLSAVWAVMSKVIAEVVIRWALPPP